MEQLEIVGNKSVRSIQTDIIKSEWQVILSGPCNLNDIDGLISLSLMATTKKKKREGSYGFCLIFGESIHSTGCYIKEI